MCAEDSHEERLKAIELRMKALEADQDVIAVAAGLAAERVGLSDVAALVRMRPVEVVTHQTPGEWA